MNSTQNATANKRLSAFPDTHIYTNELKFNFGKLHVMEKPLDVGPLCLDYDIKISKPLSCFKLVEPVQIIEIINRIVTKYYELSDSKEELESYVLTKNELYYDPKKKLYADGFHIEYPKLIMTTLDRFLIFEESKNEIIKMGYFDEVFEEIFKSKIDLDNDNENNKYNITEDDFSSEGEFTNDEIRSEIYKEIIKEVFDSVVIKQNAWFMYGSGKSKNNSIKFYKLKYIFDANVDEIENKKTNVDIAKCLAIRREGLTPINSKVDLSPKYDVITSKYINKSHMRKDVKNLFIKNEDYDEDPANRDAIANKNNKSKIEGLLAPDPNENIIMAKKLIKIINKKRAGPYNEWITVGWTLFNISSTLLPEFDEFSRLDMHKYVKGACDKVWSDCVLFSLNNSGNNCGYTIASLYKWAKEDNPIEYSNIIRANVNKLLETADIKTDYDIARILKEMYKHDFVCSDITKNIWWQFDKHRWRRIDGAYTFSLKMSEEVTKEFAKMSESYMKQVQTESGFKADWCLKKSNDVNRLIADLKKKAYKDRIIGECASQFYDTEFETKLDENTHIIGFSNGVYDLNKKLFRNGCPDDFLSMSTGYDYLDTFSYDHPQIKEIEKFVGSIHPKEEIKLYVMCYIASLLEGGNNDQKIIFWIGKGGSNGKGTLIELIDHTFGDYYGTLPVTLLTQKRKGSSNATPELADKKGKRTLVLQEPEHDDMINVGFMKELTGQDKITARALYSNSTYYVPQFKIFLACNKLPEIPSNDGGTWRRIRVVDHKERFVDNPTKPNEHPKDPELRNKLKTWKQAFIWLLINKYYPIYKKNNGLDKLEPDEVKYATEQYKQESNIYLEFIEDNLEKDKRESLPKELVWNLFKEWYTSTKTDKPPPMKKLVEYFKDHTDYKIQGNNINGIKIKANDDKIEPLDG